MDELFECLVFIFGFLYIFKWMLDFLVKKFHLHTGIFTIEGNQLVVRALFSVRYEKDKIATIIFSCMHSWRIPWAHAGKMLIIMKDRRILPDPRFRRRYRADHSVFTGGVKKTWYFFCL